MSDAERRLETARKRRILDGKWRLDLQRHLGETLGVVRSENLGRISIAVNLAKNVCEQIGSVLYEDEPTIKNDEADPTEYVEMLERLGVWSLAQRQGFYIYGLRESAYRVDWASDASEPRLEIVTPEALEVETADDDPQKLLVVRQMQLRMDPTTKKMGEFWMVWDLPRGERYLLDASMTPRPDVVATEPLAVWEGEPFLPWVLYHAAPTGHVWSPWGLEELFSAAFDVGVLWNSYHNGMRDASWKQKYALNVRLASPVNVREGTASVATTPTSVLLWESIDGQAGELGVLDTAFDVKAYGESVLTYQRTVIASLGLHPDDIEQTAAESGYAVSLKRSAQRRMAEALEPMYRHGDLQLLALIAKVCNVYGGTAYPVDGWRIDYAHRADSVAEQAEKFEYHRKLVEAGLMSKSEWLRETYSNMSEDDAMKRLVEIEVERAMLAELARRAVTDRGLQPEPEPEPPTPEVTDA